LGDQWGYSYRANGFGADRKGERGGYIVVAPIKNQHVYHIEIHRQGGAFPVIRGQLWRPMGQEPRNPEGEIIQTSWDEGMQVGIRLDVNLRITEYHQSPQIRAYIIILKKQQVKRIG